VGAGADPLDSEELRYAYEADLKVLPTFAVTPAAAVFAVLDQLPGVRFDRARLLHGEHDLQLHRPLPVSAEARTTVRVTDVFDKRSGALLALEATTETTDGEPLFTYRLTAFLRGEGGFGGASGPPPAHPAPDREPDRVLQRETLPQQALLYRLSGDRNALHADPAVATRGGFDRPILHGLCTFAIAAKAVVDEALDGRVERVARYAARFAGVVYPGETLEVRLWHDDDRILLAATTLERGAPVLSHAAITLR
jgi:acyl dehydratase